MRTISKKLPDGFKEMIIPPDSFFLIPGPAWQLKHVHQPDWTPQEHYTAWYALLCGWDFELITLAVAYVYGLTEGQLLRSADTCRTYVKYNLSMMQTNKAVRKMAIDGGYLIRHIARYLAEDLQGRFPDGINLDQLNDDMFYGPPFLKNKITGVEELAYWYLLEHSAQKYTHKEIILAALSLYRPIEKPPTDEDLFRTNRTVCRWWGRYQETSDISFKAFATNALAPLVVHRLALRGYTGRKLPRTYNLDEKEAHNCPSYTESDNFSETTHDPFQCIDQGNDPSITATDSSPQEPKGLDRMKIENIIA